MNILFVLYGDLSSNSMIPLALYARKFQERGHLCSVAVPNDNDSAEQWPESDVRALLYSDVLRSPESAFSNGRPADVIHAWTPREVVRRFVTTYMAMRPTPLIIYLEDHERWITTRMLGVEEEKLIQQTEQHVSERMPDSLSHPFRYASFIGLADAVAVIQDKLGTEVPPWVHYETVMPPVDLEFFSPRTADPILRKHYGVAEDERVIVYPGGLNSITRQSIKTLAVAVCMLNEQGVRCRLLRTGPFPLDFLHELPPEFVSFICDLGVVERRALPDLLALADVFVQPGSIDPFEDLRLPGKVPEMLAMARPVILPDVNIAHLFEDGINAVITRTGTAGEIAARCQELFSNPERADAIGRGGRRFAEKHFDPFAQAARMSKVYEIGRDNFDPVTASDVWSHDADGRATATILARKLRNLAAVPCRNSPIQVPQLLIQHAGYIDLMQARVGGLETEIERLEAQIAGLARAAEAREVQVDELNQAVMVRDGRLAGLKQALIERDGDIHFDQAWYLDQNPDVAAQGMDPYEHYVIFGRAEGRPPAPPAV